MDNWREPGTNAPSPPSTPCYTPEIMLSHLELLRTRWQDPEGRERLRRFLEALSSGPQATRRDRAAKALDGLPERSQEAELDLRAVELVGAAVQEADLSGADLRWARLQWAKLQFSTLVGADLRGAHMQRANLQGANLQRADLRRARLVSAQLRWARLEQADLGQTDLRQARLDSARFDSGTRLDSTRLFGTVTRDAAGFDPPGDTELDLSPSGDGSFLVTFDEYRRIRDDHQAWRQLARQARASLTVVLAGPIGIAARLRLLGLVYEVAAAAARDLDAGIDLPDARGKTLLTVVGPESALQTAALYLARNLVTTEEDLEEAESIFAGRLRRSQGDDPKTKPSTKKKAPKTAPLRDDEPDLSPFAAADDEDRTVVDDPLFVAELEEMALRVGAGSVVRFSPSSG